MRKTNVGVLVAIVLGAILTFGTVALAENLSWTPATTSVSGTSFTSAEMATMTFYVRIDKPNPRDNTSTGGWYYLGETRNGVSFYPADNSLASLMRSYGLGGQTVRFAVSQAFKDTDGVERDSSPSAAYSWIVPVPFNPRTSVAPTGPVIR
jgi:hypothetical protein